MIAATTEAATELAPRFREIVVRLKPSSVRPAALNVTAHFDSKDRTVTYYSASALTRKGAHIAFAAGWNRNRILDAKDGCASALWLDHAAFDVTPAEVKQLLDTFAPYGLKVEPRP